MCTHNQSFEQKFKIIKKFHMKFINFRLKKFLYIAWASFRNERLKELRSIGD